MENPSNERPPIVGKLSIISMRGCEEITSKIDWYLKQFRPDEDCETIRHPHQLPPVRNRRRQMRNCRNCPRP